MTEDIQDTQSATETAENGPERPTEANGESSKALTLYDQMAKTWKLPVSSLANLVNPPPGKAVTTGMVDMVRTASISYGIPIPGFNVIEDSKGRWHLYINAAGIQFRLATDPRGIESVIPVIEHMPDMEKDKDYVQVKTTIRMKDGSYAEDYAVSDWPSTSKGSTGFALGDLVMKLITKSVRRASTRLVGTLLPTGDEDFYEYISSGSGKEAVEAKWQVIEPTKPKKDKPVVLSDLLTMALELDKSLNAAKLMEIMGVNNPTELDIAATWERITTENHGDSTALSDTE